MIEVKKQGPIITHDREVLQIVVSETIPPSQIDEFNRLFPSTANRDAQFKRFKLDVQDRMRDAFYEKAREYTDYEIFDEVGEWGEYMGIDGLLLVGVFSLIQWREPEV